MRALLFLFASALAVGLWVYALVDCAMTDSSRARGIPKAAWVVVIVVLPIIGAVLWLTLGKDRSSGRGSSRQMAPDDDPAFLRRLNTDRDQEERIRRLEKELSDLDDDNKDA